jgi:hypothetical protein
MRMLVLIGAILATASVLIASASAHSVRSHHSGVNVKAHQAVGQPPCTWAPQDSAGDACGICGNGGPGYGNCTLGKLRSDVAWCARAWKAGSSSYWANVDKCHDEATFLASLGGAPRWYAGCIGGAATGARFIMAEPWNSIAGCLIGVGFAYLF